VIIDTASTRSTGQLGVLRWSEKLVAISGELCELVDHHGPCWHVDAQSESLCRENDPHESFDEALFNGFFEGRNKASMMTGNTSLKRVEPAAIVKDPEILICELFNMGLSDLSDSNAFLGSRIAETGAGAGSHCFVAAISAEHEKDCREHRSFGE
jgi:hypothetical protein